MALPDQDSATPRGEPWVWFSSLGLIVGLVMVLGLLGLVLMNGLSVFWAPPVPVVRLDDGTSLIGQLAQRRIRPGSPASAPRYERQYQVGLRELNGHSYVWVDESRVRAEEFPADVLGLERMENGPAFVRPMRLTRADGRVVEVADPAFAEALAAEVAAGAGVRERLTEINRGRIGEVNAAMEQTRVDLRRAEDQKTPTEAIRRAMTALEVRYATLESEANQIKATGETAKLLAREAGGREVVVPMAQVVREWFPNRLGFADRLGLFFRRLGEFIFGEPREANTEGGLMPAIFGTLVMTVFMSLLVTPFGVIAAIYLREYAQQGSLLRIVRISVNNLAGVPSIVFGVFGVFQHHDNLHRVHDLATRSSRVQHGVTQPRQFVGNFRIRVVPRSKCIRGRGGNRKKTPSNAMLRQRREVSVGRRGVDQSNESPTSRQYVPTAHVQVVPQQQPRHLQNAAILHQPRGNVVARRGL